jgi:hypothetical protein
MALSLSSINHHISTAISFLGILMSPPFQVHQTLPLLSIQPNTIPTPKSTHHLLFSYRGHSLQLHHTPLAIKPLPFPPTPTHHLTSKNIHFTINSSLNEANKNRANANRLFDSQNNNRGGTNVVGTCQCSCDAVSFRGHVNAQSSIMQLQNTDRAVRTTTQGLNCP